MELPYLPNFSVPLPTKCSFTARIAVKYNKSWTCVVIFALKNSLFRVWNDVGFLKRPTTYYCTCRGNILNPNFGKSLFLWPQYFVVDLNTLLFSFWQCSGQITGPCNAQMRRATWISDVENWLLPVDWTGQGNIFSSYTKQWLVGVTGINGPKTKPNIYRRLALQFSWEW